MRHWLSFVAVVALTLAGCGRQQPEHKITIVADDDPKMNAAIEKARGTVDTFIAAVTSPKPGQSGFTVKMAFSDGSNGEHMWLTPVIYDGTNFTGTVSNNPETVTNVSMGDQATVAPAEISDWMYIDNRKLVGGETLRVLRDTLTPSERAEFDKGLPFVIE